MTFEGVNDLNLEHHFRQSFRTFQEALMDIGNLVFSQIMEIAPWHTFRFCVAKYPGDFNVRTIQLCGPVSVDGL